MVPVIDEGDCRSDTFFSSRSIQPKPRNPIMAEKPLMSPITLRALLSFNSFLQHIVSISSGSVTSSDYQCPHTAQMFCRPSVLNSSRAESLMNGWRLYSFPMSGATQD